MLLRLAAGHPGGRGPKLTRPEANRTHGAGLLHRRMRDSETSEPHAASLSLRVRMGKLRPEEAGDVARSQASELELRGHLGGSDG